MYLDKDLVLPPMGTSGLSETFFVVASTDLQHAGIMSTRIREQLENVTGAKEKGTLTITTAPVDVPPANAGDSLEQQIQTVAGCIMGMVMSSLEKKYVEPGKKAKAEDCWQRKETTF